MAITALDEKNQIIYAADITDPSEAIHCKYCSDTLIFINAQQRNKHFRHQPHSGCSNSVRGWEPETKEHEEHKGVILETIQKMAMATPAARGLLEPEFNIGDFRPDIYWVPEAHNMMFSGIAFEVQASNYDIDTYIEKMEYYRANNIYTVYLFLAKDSPFMTETRTCVFSLKAIERLLMVQAEYKTSLYAAHMHKKDIYDYTWQCKIAKGQTAATNDTLFVTRPKPMSKLSIMKHPTHYLESFLIKILNIVTGNCPHQRYHYDPGLQYLARRCFDCGKVLDYRDRFHPGIAISAQQSATVYREDPNLREICLQWAGHQAEWDRTSPISFLPAYRGKEPVYKVFCSRCGHYYETLGSDLWKAMGLPEIHAKSADREHATRLRMRRQDYIDAFWDECAQEAPVSTHPQPQTTHPPSIQLLLPYGQPGMAQQKDTARAQKKALKKSQQIPQKLF